MLISLQNFISALEWTAKTSALFSKHKNKTWWPDNAVFCIHISLTFVLNTQANQRGKLRADGPSLLIAFLLFLAHTITHFSLTLMSHLHFSFPCPSGVKSLTFAGNWCWVISVENVSIFRLQFFTARNLLIFCLAFAGNKNFLCSHCILFIPQ